VFLFEFCSKNHNISTSWFVSSAKDIADFTIYIRSAENEILYQKSYDYNVRSAVLNTLTFEFNTNDLNHAELCIVSKDSNGRTGKWYPTQCRQLPAMQTSRSFFNLRNAGTMNKYSSIFFLLLIFFQSF